MFTEAYQFKEVKKLSKEFQDRYNEYVETYNEAPNIKKEEGVPKVIKEESEAEQNNPNPNKQQGKHKKVANVAPDDEPDWDDKIQKLLDKYRGGNCNQYTDI